MKMVNMTLSEGKILILEVIYGPFELKIQLKMSILRPKIMPKQHLNISKRTSKSPKNDFFGPQNSKITVTNFGNLAKSVDSLVYFGHKSSNIASKVLKPILKSFPLHARHLTTLKT